MSSRLAAALALVGSVALAGCALRPVVPGTDVGWAARRDALLALPGWQLKGRIAANFGEQHGQGRLQWRQAGDSARLRLSGPFGSGAWQLEWNARRVRLTDGKGESVADYTGPGAVERFLDERLGWRFPAERAAFWVLGMAAPGGGARLGYDDSGWLEQIEQGGWTIHYEDYRQRGGFWMPRKLRLESARGSARLVIDRWQPLPGGTGPGR